MVAVCVGNMDEVESSKEVIESNIETKDKKLGMKKSYAEIVINSNKKRNAVSTEISHDHPIQHDDARPNLCSINDNATVWSHCKPSDM